MQEDAELQQPVPKIRERNYALWLLVCSMAVWIAGFMLVRAHFAMHGRGVLYWDAAWYAQIAAGDYHFDGDITHQQSVAFLPAYPYAVRLLLVLGVPVQAAVLLPCLTCAVVGTLLFFRTLRAHLDSMTSAMACVLLIASPFSLYLLNGYSESLYFLAMAAFFWALLCRRDDGLAALFSGVAGLVRPFGVLLAVVWAVDVVLRSRQARLPWRDAALRIVALGPIAIAGPLLVCLFYSYRFEDLFLYHNILMAWGVDVLGGSLSELLDHLAVEWRTLTEWHPSLIGASPPECARLLLAMSVAIVPLTIRRIPIQLVLYGLCLIAFCLLTTESGGNLGRHLATNVAFPTGLAILLSPASGQKPGAWSPWRNLLVAAIVITGFLTQIYYAWFYFSGHWVS